MKAIATTTLSILLLAALAGCSSAPTEKTSEAAPAVSQAPSATSTPSPEAKPVEAFVAPAAVKAPADPEVLANIAAIDNCMVAAFTYKVWEGITVKPEVPVGHQELAKDYVALTEKKISELGCSKG